MATRDQIDPVVLAIRDATHKRLELLLLDMHHKLLGVAKFVSDNLLIDANELENTPGSQKESTSANVEGASAPTRKRVQARI